MKFSKAEKQLIKTILCVIKEDNNANTIIFNKDDISKITNITSDEKFDEFKEICRTLLETPLDIDKKEEWITTTIIKSAMFQNNEQSFEINLGEKVKDYIPELESYIK